eukprot:244430_1
MGCCTSTPPEHDAKSNIEPVQPEKKPLMEDNTPEEKTVIDFINERNDYAKEEKYESKYNTTNALKADRETVLEPKKYISDKVVMHLSVRDVIGMDNDSIIYMDNGQFIAPTSQLLSDPFIVVYEMDMSTESFKEIGRTEVIKNNSNADFSKEFIIPYIFNEYQIFRFDVYDCNSDNLSDLSQHDYLGSSTFILAEIIHEIGSVQTKKLVSKHNEFYQNKKTKKYSTITIYIDTNHNEDMKDEMIEKFVQFDIEINSNLSAKNTLCSIYRIDETKTIKVYSTEIVSNTYKPKYKTIYIDTFTLCRSNYQKELLFTIDEHYENKNDNRIYTESISMSEIIQNKDKTLNKNKITLKNIKTLMYNLTDYLYDSFDISIIFGIDFTASNGDPEQPYSLHYIYDQNKLSHYQIAIRAVGNILQSYDTDNMYPVYGFGAKLINDKNDIKTDIYNLDKIIKTAPTNFVFPINENNEECQGIFNIENAYQNILQNKKKLILSAPTNFSPMLQKVINNIENTSKKNKNLYFIFLIITDGQISDMKETKKLIQYAANKPLPLSIIIIGVGNDNFDNMSELDGDDGELGNRDIVQFVEMNSFINKHNGEIDKNKLSLEVLYEIPNQLLSYMSIINHTPNLEIHKQTDNKNVIIGEIYNINQDKNTNETDEKTESKTDNNIQNITTDTPIPFGWEKYYDQNGNIIVVNAKGQIVSNNEFFSMININSKHNPNTKNWLYPEVDLVFCLDVTGSMQNEINASKQSIKHIVETIKNDENAYIRFGYVAYIQESTFLTKTHPFTSNVKKMEQTLSLYNANGGGDSPEAVAAGLNESLQVHINDFRENAVKIIVLITDAAPHGVGCSGDRIPNGNPNVDLIKLANTMRKKGILLYIIGCEPDLSDDRARNVYRALCKITFGKYIGIIDEHLIAPIIIKSVSEEINMKMLQYHVEIKGNKNISVLEYLRDELNKKQKLMQIEDIYGVYDKSNVNLIVNECKNIKDIKNKYKTNYSKSKPKSTQSGNVTLQIKEIDDKCVERIIEKINAQK